MIHIPSSFVYSTMLLNTDPNLSAQSNSVQPGLSIQGLLIPIFFTALVALLFWLLRRYIERLDINLSGKIDTLESGLNDKIDTLTKTDERLEKKIDGTSKYFLQRTNLLSDKVALMQGQYVAYRSLKEREVLAVGPDIGEVLAEAIKKGATHPLIVISVKDESHIQ